MKRRTPQAWRSKLDPNLDKPVKFFVKSLSDLEKSPREGRLAFPTELISPALIESGWQTAYSFDQSSHEDMLSFMEQFGLSMNTTYGVLDAEKPSDLLLANSNLVQFIPEEDSRAYYFSKIDHYKNNPNQIPTDDALNKSSIEYFSIFFSLFIRSLLEQITLALEPMGDTDAEDFIRSKAMTSVLSIVYYQMSGIANQLSLTDLIEKLTNGDDKALFKAVTIDKSILYREEVKKRVITAQPQGDSAFLKKLGHAIAVAPLSKVGQHGKTYTVLMMFWLAGLYRLTNEELYHFLKHCGLIPPDYPDGFQKFIRRHIKPAFNLQ